MHAEPRDVQAVAVQPKPRRRRVNSKNDFKQGAFVASQGAPPAVSLSAVANGQSPRPSLWKPPANLSPPPAKPTHPRVLPSRCPALDSKLVDPGPSNSEWTQHWDEEVGSHYYFNSTTGMNGTVPRRSNGFSQGRPPGFAKSDGPHRTKRSDLANMPGVPRSRLRLQVRRVARLLAYLADRRRRVGLFRDKRR